MGFCLSVESSQTMSTGQTTLQGSSQTLLNKVLAHSPNGRGAHVQRLADVLVRPARPFWTCIGFEQDAGVEEFACRCFPCGKHLVKSCTFLFGQFHNVLLVHVCSP